MTKKAIIIHQYVNADGSASAMFEVQCWNDKDSCIGCFQANLEKLFRLQEFFFKSNKPATFEELSKV